MEKSHHRTSGPIANLLGVLFLVFIVGSLVALMTFLYSTPSVESTPKENVPPDKYSKTIERAVGAEHFHILDDTVYADLENATICLLCHGNFCHTKSEKMRSYYNMHTFFLACEACHLVESGRQEVVFMWFDDRSGKVVKELKGRDGNYGAKIVPVRDGKRLDAFPKEKLAREYMERKDALSEEDKKEICAELMKDISKEPVACEECHRKKGYLDYQALGYSRGRSAELSRIEIVEMSTDYEDFFLPGMFDPSLVGKKVKGN
jgi:hypothetical protein